MSTETTQTQTSTPAAKPVVSRRKQKAEGRKKRALKLQTNKEFAKAYFEGKSKRAADKKSAFRKKKSRKK